MRVITKEADTLEQYVRDRGTDLRDYEKNALAGARADDAVYLVTFLVDSPLKSAQTAYPVPASRIAKEDLDSVDHVGGDGHGPVHHPMDYAIQAVLTAMLFHARQAGVEPSTIRTQALKSGVPEAVVDEADELAQIRVEEQADEDADLGDFDG